MSENATEEKTVEVNGVQMTEQQKTEVTVEKNQKLVEVQPGVFKTLTKMQG